MNDFAFRWKCTKNRGLTAKQVGALIFGHPTMAEGIMEAVHDIHGECVHLAKKKK